MKNKNTKFKSKKFRLVVFLLLLVIVGAILFYILTKDKSDSNSQDEAAMQAQQEAAVNSDAKKEFIEGQQKADPSKPGSSNSSGAQPPSSASKNIDLSARQEPNANVTVFTKLTSYSSGTCQLKVSNGALTTSQSAEIVYQPEFSTCAGFSVPVNSLGPGTWTIALTVTSAGSSETKSILLEVK